MKVVDGIRLILGVLFLWSGLTKSRHPYEFLEAVYAYQLVGPGLGVIIAAWLPWLELGIGCCLLGGFLTEASLLIAVLLSGMFCLAIASAWRRGLAISCGCTGAGSQTIDGLLVLRSVGLFLFCLLGLMFAMRPWGSRSVIARGRSWSGTGHPNRGRFLAPPTGGTPVHEQWTAASSIGG